jgi:hypothetical protein
MTNLDGITLYWLPLGAGGHCVRLNGRLFEALVACHEHRPVRDLYHSARGRAPGWHAGLAIAARQAITVGRHYSDEIGPSGVTVRAAG